MSSACRVHRANSDYHSGQINEGYIHTTQIMGIIISSLKREQLAQRMENLGIKEEDLEEHFVRSSGKGGQNVNKNATCVYLKHRPTEIEVKCQKERSQATNRFFARRALCDKIDEKMNNEKSQKKQQIEKIRRQKRKRSKRAKEKILLEKKKQAEKKERRRSPGM